MKRFYPICIHRIDLPRALIFIASENVNKSGQHKLTVRWLKNSYTCSAFRLKARCSTRFERLPCFRLQDSVPCLADSAPAHDYATRSNSACCRFPGASAQRYILRSCLSQMTTLRTANHAAEPIQRRCRAGLGESSDRFLLSQPCCRPTWYTEVV